MAAEEKDAELEAGRTPLIDQLIALRNRPVRPAGPSARLFRCDRVRISLLYRVRESGRGRHSADRARSKGQRIPIAGDDPAVCFRGRVPAAGAADVDGTGRTGDRGRPRLEAAVRD